MVDKEVIKEFLEEELEGIEIPDLFLSKLLLC